MRSTQAGAGRIRAAHHGTEHGLSEPAASAVEAPRLSRLRHAALARDAGVSGGLSFYSLLLLRTISGDGDGPRANAGSRWIIKSPERGSSARPPRFRTMV